MSAFSLVAFVNGDTGYVAKLNNNNSAIVAAIIQLQAASGGASGAASVTAALSGIFGSSAGLIGKTSYLPTGSGANLTIAAGYAWNLTTQTVVQLISPAVLSFSGQASGTYYINLDAIGNPSFSSTNNNAVYSVAWNGSAFGTITLLANLFMTATEETALLYSTTNTTQYGSLLARLEAIETQYLVKGSSSAFGIVKVDGTTITASGGVISAGGGTALISNIQQDTYIFGTDTGTANAYNVSQSPAPTLAPGSQCVFKCANTNTGASTLAINSGSAIAIKKQGSVALAAGDFVAGQMIDLTYDGTYWQIIASADNNPVAPTGTAGQVYAAPAGASGALTPRALVGSDLPAATTGIAGAVKPDGTTITISSGVISAVASGASVSAVQQDAYGYAADTGAANAYAVALSPSPTVVAGMTVTFKAANANTGASTLALNGGSATAIRKNGSATALVSGDIVAGQIVCVTYDGTYWQIPTGSANNTPTSPMTLGFLLNTGASGTNVAPLLIAPRAGTLNSFVIVTKASDSSTALTIDILQNGTSIFTSTKPSIAAGTAAGTVTTFTTLTSTPLPVAKNDVFQINVTSGTSTWQATLQLET